MMMLSGIGTNAIGFDLDPNVSHYSLIGFKDLSYGCWELIRVGMTGDGHLFMHHVFPSLELYSC